MFKREFNQKDVFKHKTIPFLEYQIIKLIDDTIYLQEYYTGETLVLSKDELINNFIYYYRSKYFLRNDNDIE